MNTHNRFHTASFTLLLAALVGCGGAAGEGPGGTGDSDTGSEPHAEVGPDAGSPRADAPPTSDSGRSDGAPSSDGGAGCPATVDLPDDLGTDENCDGADGVVGVDVYVMDGGKGADTNAGTPQKPLATIDAAIKMAQKRSGHVLLARGHYAVDLINAPGAWSIYGGYDSVSFSGTIKRELTFLDAQRPSGVLLDVATEARLAHLTVVGIAGTDKVLTAHALRSAVGKLVLDDVVVRAADGRAGERGEDGGAGSAGMQGGTSPTWNIYPFAGKGAVARCEGLVTSASSNGADGNLANAEGRAAGKAADKLMAQAGSPGHAGADGPDGSTNPTLSPGSLTLVWGSGGSGLGNGAAGFGGAGGGGSWDEESGGGGSGGCPGVGAKGGQGGGGAVAVLVLKGELTATRSTFETGFAGDGGAGGVGGPGGPGGLGGLPRNAAGPLSPTCSPSSDHYGCATYGGLGGAGGAGGHGGGGAGAWALGVVTAKGSIASVDPACVFHIGDAGVGGAGNGGGRAPDGKRLNTLALE